MLNLTLVVEIINFFCAYLIITRIALKPLSALLLAEEVKKEQLMQSLQTLQGELAAQREHLAQEASSFYKNLYHQQPLLIVPEPLKDAARETVTIDVFPSLEIEKELQQAMVKKVLYD